MIEKYLEREIELVNLICDGLRVDPHSPDDPAHFYNTGSGAFFKNAVSTWKEVISKLIDIFDFVQHPEQRIRFKNLSLQEKAKIDELINNTYRSSLRLMSVLSCLKQEYPDFVLEVNNSLNKLKSIKNNLMVHIEV